MKAFFDDIISVFKNNPRIASQRTLAQQNNWSFLARRKWSNDAVMFRKFQLFKGPSGKRLLAVIKMNSSIVAGQFRIYDFVYYGNLGNKTTTVFEYHNPKLKLSPFSIRPKGTLTTLKELFDTTRLLFATTPEFNERYEISATDQEAIKEHLNEDFLDDVGDEAGWIYEGEQDVLIAYQYGKRIPTHDVLSNFKRFERLSERLVNGRRAIDF